MYIYVLCARTIMVFATGFTLYVGNMEGSEGGSETDRSYLFKGLGSRAHCTILHFCAMVSSVDSQYQ